MRRLGRRSDNRGLLLSRLDVSTVVVLKGALVAELTVD
jgi:hypothetical protein